MAFLTWVFLVFVFGAADRLFVLWGLSYDTQLYIFRIGICIVPLLLFVITRRVCRERLAAERVEEDRHRAEQEAETHEQSLAAGFRGLAARKNVPLR